MQYEYRHVRRLSIPNKSTNNNFLNFLITYWLQNDLRELLYCGSTEDEGCSTALSMNLLAARVVEELDHRCAVACCHCMLFCSTLWSLVCVCPRVSSSVAVKRVTNCEFGCTHEPQLFLLMLFIHNPLFCGKAFERQSCTGHGQPWSSVEDRSLSHCCCLQYKLDSYRHSRLQPDVLIGDRLEGFSYLNKTLQPPLNCDVWRAIWPTRALQVATRGHMSSIAISP